MKPPSTSEFRFNRFFIWHCRFPSGKSKCLVILLLCPGYGSIVLALPNNAQTTMHAAEQEANATMAYFSVAPARSVGAFWFTSCSRADLAMQGSAISFEDAGTAGAKLAEPRAHSNEPPIPTKTKNQNIRISPAVLDTAGKNGEKLLRHLRPSLSGLTQAEAEGRARTTGPNEVAQERKQVWPLRVLLCTSPMAECQTKKVRANWPQEFLYFFQSPSMALAISLAADRNQVDFLRRRSLKM